RRARGPRHRGMDGRMAVSVLIGDARERLRDIPDASVNCAVTSPPYWGLRDYGVAGQIGLELTPDEYVENLVAVFREVRRILRPEGTLWLNLGDAYANPGHYKGNPGEWGTIGRPRITTADDVPIQSKTGPGLKNKDLIGLPWMVAFALRDDGWYLRSEI